MITKAINGESTVLAILGDPVNHSLSPQMHNAAFKALQLDCVYVPFRVKAEALPAAVRAISALNFKGANVTSPYKQAVIAELDEIFGDAQISGSVNTIINQNGQLRGTSTDGSGFLRSLREDGQFEPAGKKMLLLGAGGSARAVLYKLIAAGIKSVTLVNRDLIKAVNLQQKIWIDTGFTLDLHELNHWQTLPWDCYDLLVNTTSVGLHEDVSLVPSNFLVAPLLVYDLVYKKGGTKLYNEAVAAGCKVLSGLSLLLYQGLESFKLWFNVAPPIQVMRAALKVETASNLIQPRQ